MSAPDQVRLQFGLLHDQKLGQTSAHRDPLDPDWAGLPSGWGRGGHGDGCRGGLETEDDGGLWDGDAGRHLRTPDPHEEKTRR